MLFEFLSSLVEPLARNLHFPNRFVSEATCHGVFTERKADVGGCCNAIKTERTKKIIKARRAADEKRKIFAMKENGRESGKKKQ